MTDFSLVVVNGPTTLLGNLNFGDNGQFGSALYGDYRGKLVGDWRFTAGNSTQKIIFQNSVNEALLTIDTETGQIIFEGSVAQGTEQIIANSTLTTDDGRYVFCNATSAGFTITLPLASLSAGLEYSFVKTDATANVVTIDGAGSETINGSANTTLTTQYQTVTIACNGTTWYRLGSATDVTALTTNVNNLITLSGVAANATSLGTFTGATIPDNQTNKQALQALETSLETNNTTTANLVTLSGVATNATNLGTFTGTTIADNQTVKVALQSLETAVEAAGGGASVGSSITSNTTITTSNAKFQPCSSASGNITITLPSAATSAGKEFTFLRTNTSANTITIDANASETIDGSLTSVLRFINERLTIWCDGTAWYKKEHYAEGTFTPALFGSGVAGTNTYTTRTGHFHRDMNKVYIDVRILLSAKDAAMTGDININGLPIASKTIGAGGPAINSMSLSLVQNLTLTSAVQMFAFVSDGVSSVSLRKLIDGAANQSIPVADVSNTTQISFNGFYTVDN